ncbi:Ig-like protein group 2 [Paenibacillus taihuensis]|uniref:Ig-like protein group 2 n=1 Tax=Paenibacillus taihuensis TaxID=1156355 RepID=A0A3D9SC57_9BACL|nr:Ig-like domain-containing protein [Paenibacillus taihuensis]REE91477.1 Ig-like protein group 2 [Paenibacillus taihuensis]
MRMNRQASPAKHYRPWLTVMLAFVLTFSSFAGIANADEVVTSISFDDAPYPAILYVDDDTIALHVNATIQGATSVKDVTADSTWTSSNNSVVKVSGGVLTGLTNGSATITATYKGYKTTLPVTVQYLYDTVTLNDGSTDLPATAAVKLGATLKYELTASKSGQADEDVTDDATWSSLNTAVATVKDGEITLLGAGETTITAKYKGRSDSIKLTVSSPFKSISIPTEDDLLELNTGDDPVTLDASAERTDGGSIPVADTATWVSSNTSVVTVSKGVVTPVGSGLATITASYLGASGSVSVVVRPSYEALTLTPKEDLHLTLQDEPVTITAEALKGSAPAEDVTESATWNSSNVYVATVKNGVISPKGVGTTVIKASYKGLTKQINVTVYPTVTSVKVAKDTLDAFLNDTVTLPSVSAASISGETVDVTNLASWTSSDTDVLDKVDGKWTAKKLGTATLTGTVQSKTVTIAVKVNEKPLLLTPDQAYASIVIGKEAKLPTITVTYENGNEEDVTGLVTWKSSSSNLIVKAPNMRGLLASSVTLTATYLGKSTSIRVTIEEEITKVFVDATSFTLNPGRTKTMKVTGIYKSGKSVSLGTKMNWTVNPETLASVKGATVKALVEGTGKLTGSYQGKSVEVSLTVIPKLKKLTPSTKTLTLAAEGKDSVQISAEYDNGKITDVTKTAAWTSGNAKVATVDDGVITAVAKGSTTIRATYNGKSVSIRVLVK